MKKSIFRITFLFACLLLFPSYAMAQLPAPNGLHSEFGENYIKWEWDPVTSANKYVFSEAYMENGVTRRDISQTVYGQTYYIQQDPIPNQDYTAWVGVDNGSETSPNSNLVTIVFVPLSQIYIGITEKSPDNNATNVPVGQSINMFFSYNLNSATVNTNNITLTTGTETVATSVYLTSSNHVRIDPLNPLKEGTVYTISVSGIKSIENYSLLPTTWNFTTYTPVAPSGGGSIPVTTTVPITIPSAYTDVTNHWAKDSIQILVNKQILPSNMTNFYPNNEINREDFVKLLIIGMKYPTTVYSGKFTDVTLDNPNAVYIQAAIDKGIIQGTSTTTFDPTKPITREEIFAMFDRTLKLENITPTMIEPLTEFKDYQTVSTWAVDSVKNIYSLGLLKGKTDVANVIIDPIANTSNAENATLLVRLLEKVGK